MDLGLVLGRVWEAKILDFRTFFDVFSMLISKRVREGEKMHQKSEKSKVRSNLGSGLRWSPGSWGEIIERGSQNISDSLIETWPSRSGPEI